MTLDNILEEIRKAQNIVILVHENPDGDAIGSATAMYQALKKLNKYVDLIIPEYPRNFSFLPVANEIKKEGTMESYDLAIALDCASPKLLSSWLKYFNNAKSKVVIDHHGSNSMYGDYNYVDPNSPACAQVLVGVLKYFGIEISKEIGICILTGIITDTGGFAYSGVSADTFEIASSLVSKGINVANIYQNVFSNTSKSKFELHKIAINRLELLEDSKIAFTYITRNDEVKVGAENGDYDGIVEKGRDLEGVEVSVFIREIEDGMKKISLRSKNYVNVSEVCVAYGGGGHPRAAGCKIQGSMEQAKMQIVNKIKKFLK